MSIETKISPLIENMFPSFYKEDGENFIAFVKAYYEWLENNFQLLTLKSNENFNVGDTVIQGSVTGTVVSFVNSDMLVLVNEFDTFKCVTVCSDLTPIVSSSGGSSVISKGGKTRRLGATFLARNLMTLRDVDTTMDIFLTNFKQKYLRNIDFDTSSNKRLFIKNSLDLYRSKGTSRSIDLFFRLMYGVNASVYYPGDDLFKLSEGEWYKPQYLEISCIGDSSFRAVQMVGKIITGVTSGAQAFVEKYIKHRTANGFTHVLYISNISGVFKRRELIRSDVVYLDSPSIIGSLDALTSITTSSSGFNIGDIVEVHSISGINGKARVTSVNDLTGAIDFKLLNGGWGYSVNIGNTDPTFTTDHSQTIVSDEILFLKNINIGNVISSATILAPGLGYSNTDIITVLSEYSNAVARPVTNSTGGVTSIVLCHPGSGFFATSPAISVANSTGGTSTGAGLSASFSYSVPSKSFAYLENIIQKKASILFNTAVDSSQLSVGVNILVSNGSSTIGTGVIQTVTNDTSTSGSMTLLLSNNFMVNSNNKIVIAANNLVTANIVSYTDVSASGALMSIPSSGTLYVSTGALYYDLVENDVLYQKNQSNEVIAMATVSDTVTSRGIIPVQAITGSFIAGMNVYSTNSPLNVSLNDFRSDLGIFNISNTFTSASVIDNAKVLFPYSGINAIIERISSGGSSAKYNIGTIANYETVSLNTDVIGNTFSLSKRLNSSQFNFPTQPSANLNSVIFNSLTYKDFVLGEVYDLGPTDPGFGYTHDPYLLTYQPYMAGYDFRDFIFNISNVSGSFLKGEIVEQQFVDNRTIIYMANTSPYVIGERVYTSNSTQTYVSNSTVVDKITDHIIVNDIQGTIRDTDFLKKFANTAVNTDITVVATTTANIVSHAIIKEINKNTIYAKRIQFNNNFNPKVQIVGHTTKATANISIGQDYSVSPIGWNASVSASVFISNGVVTGLDVADSGFGFINGQEAQFTFNGKSGSAIVSNAGVGIGSGRYKNGKGFLSDFSKIHDGNYYQEYSYDVMSRIPLEKYADMFKKVMHMAGTKQFGSVLVDSLNEITVSAANSQIDYYDPYAIQNRILDYVQDRSNIEIEIRT